MDKRIGFGNRWSVGRVSVIWLWWSVWCRCGVRGGLGPGSGVMSV